VGQEKAPLVRQFLKHEFATTPRQVAVQAHEHRGKAVPSQLRGVMGKVARLRSALAISDDHLVAHASDQLVQPPATPPGTGGVTAKIKDALN
jgi:hypothetical protein